MLMQDQETNEQLVVWHHFQDKILVKIKSYSAVADDSTNQYFCQNNNYEPAISQL
jgi:hypothetical protein